MTGNTLELFTPEAAQEAAPAGVSDLFPAPGAFGVGATEAQAVATLQALHQASPFTQAQRLAAQVIRSLAVNIDKGNLKGRAVGNEAMQLMAALEAISGTGPGDEPVAGNIPPDAQRLMDALALAPVSPGGVSAWSDADTD